jgi:hypothetical protein
VHVGELLIDTEQGRLLRANGEVLLLAVDGPIAAADLPALQIAWRACSARGCARSLDPRTVDGRADSDNGEPVLRP